MAVSWSHKLMIGISSYLGNTEELRQRRIKAHNKQLDWVIRHFPGAEIFIVAQDYRDAQKWSYPNINYIESKQITPSASRNLLLKEFYESDFDYFLMLDNDCVLYEYYNMQQTLEQIPDILGAVDMVFPLQAMHSPFVKANNKDDFIKEYYKLERTLRLSVALLFMVNIKKTHNLELYQDESLVFGEDREWACNIIKHGLRLAKCGTMILKELNTTNHSTLASSFEDRNKHHKAVLGKIAEKYPPMEYKNGKFTGNKFIKHYAKINSIVWVQRSTPVDTENYKDKINE